MSDQSSGPTATIAYIEPVTIAIERRFNGDLDVMLNDFCYVSIHYNYRYTDNSDQYSLADWIIKRRDILDTITRLNARVAELEMQTQEIARLSRMDE